jgi:hypothetical protein
MTDLERDSYVHKLIRSIYIRLCMYIEMHECINTSTYIHKYVHIYIYIHTHIHTYIHTHTHIHTHTDTHEGVLMST